MDANDFVTRQEHETFEKLMKVENERLHDEDNRLNHRLKIVEDTITQINALTISVEKMAINMERMVTEQERLGNRIGNLEAEPGKRYSTIKTVALTALITAVVSGIVGIVMGRLF